MCPSPPHGLGFTVLIILGANLISKARKTEQLEGKQEEEKGTMKFALVLLFFCLCATATATQSLRSSRTGSDGAGESGTGSSGASGESGEGPKLPSDYFKPDLIKRGTLQQELANNPVGEIEKGVVADGKDKGDIENGSSGAAAGASGAGAKGAKGASGASGQSKDDCSGAGGPENSKHITIVKEVDTKSGFGTPEDALLNSPKKNV